jgi:large repetitive protein
MLNKKFLIAGLVLAALVAFVYFFNPTNLQTDITSVLLGSGGTEANGYTATLSHDDIDPAAAPTAANGSQVTLALNNTTSPNNEGVLTVQITVTSVTNQTGSPITLFPFDQTQSSLVTGTACDLNQGNILVCEEPTVSMAGLSTVALQLAPAVLAANSVINMQVQISVVTAFTHPQIGVIPGNESQLIPAGTYNLQFTVQQPPSASVTLTSTDNPPRTGSTLQVTQSNVTATPAGNVVVTITDPTGTVVETFSDPVSGDFPLSTSGALLVGVYTATVNVNSGAATDSSTLSVSNTAPIVASTTGNMSGATATFTVTATDPDPQQTLIFTLKDPGGTVVASFNESDPATRSHTFSSVAVPFTTSSQTLNYTVTVTDTIETSSPATAAVTVPANTAPVIDPISPAISLTEVGPVLSALVSSLTVTDPESPPQTVSTTLTAIDPSLTITNNSGSPINAGDPITVPFTVSTVAVPSAAAGTETPTFTLTASDGVSSTPLVTTVTITRIDDDPEINAISPQSTTEDPDPNNTYSFNITVLDPESNPLALTVTDPNRTGITGRVSAAALGSTGTHTVTLTLPRNFNTPTNGPVTLQVQAVAGGATATEDFTLTISAQNDAPTITDPESKNGREDTPLTFGVTVDDEDGNSGLDLEATIIADANGVIDTIGITDGAPPVVFNNPFIPNAHAEPLSSNQGTVTITPNPNQSGTATIGLTVTDPSGATATQNVQVTFNPDPDKPDINTIPNAQVDEGGTYSLNFSFTDPDEQDLRDYTVNVSVPTGVGSPSTPIVSKGNGDTYNVAVNIPSGTATGPQSITITVDDGQNFIPLATETFILTISNQNTAPTLNTITNQSTPEETPKDVSFIITDPDDNTVDVSVTSSTASVSATTARTQTITNNTATGSITLTPALNFVGTATITLTVEDGEGSDSKFFTLTVTNINDNPVATNDGSNTSPFKTLREDDPATTLNVLANDSDVDAGTTLRVTSVTQGTKGTVTITNSGANISYTPNANANGADTFTYTITDQATPTPGTATASVFVFIDSDNDAPVANNDSGTAYTTNEDSTLTVNAPGVLANDTDVEGDSLTASVDQTPANGTLTFNADGSFTYRPAPNFNGSDSFTYTVSDGQSVSPPATVAITVTSQNDPIEIRNDLLEFTIASNESAGFNAINATQATDPDGDPISVAIATQPTNGTVSLVSPDSITYTPNTGFSGADTFTFQLSDGNGSLKTITVTIIVTTSGGTINLTVPNLEEIVLSLNLSTNLFLIQEFNTIISNTPACVQYINTGRIEAPGVQCLIDEGVI